MQWVKGTNVAAAAKSQVRLGFSPWQELLYAADVTIKKKGGGSKLVMGLFRVSVFLQWVLVFVNFKILIHFL